MSGPVTAADATTDVQSAAVGPAVLEVTESRASRVGAFPVRRALSRRIRRTVGPRCFVDHTWSAMAHPTTLRLQASTTTAR